MAEREYENQVGKAWYNKNRDPKKKQPNFRGFCMVEGIEQDVSIWVNQPTDDQGNPTKDKWLYMKFDAPYVKPDQDESGASSGGQSTAPKGGQLDDDDIPF